MMRLRTYLWLILLLTACGKDPYTVRYLTFEAPSEFTSLDIIDAHTHTGFNQKPEPTSGIMNSAASYRRAWQDAHVVGGISHLGTTATANPELSDLPMLYCVGVGEQVNLARIEILLQKSRYGCIKIYLGYVHRYAYDADFHPVYRLAAKYDVPVVFHTGDTYSSKGKLKYADPLTVDEVAVDFPDTRFVIAHLGNPWFQSAAEVAYKNPNVFIEGSALVIGNLSQYGEEWLDDLAVSPLKWTWRYLENPEKLMFGSDWPLVDIATYARLYQKAIPQEYWQDVFHDNALKVFPKLAE